MLVWFRPDPPAAGRLDRPPHPVRARPPLLSDLPRLLVVASAPNAAPGWDGRPQLLPGILDQGRIPTYLHPFDNLASSRVEEAAGMAA